jgi:hypothetical protein
MVDGVETPTDNGAPRSSEGRGEEDDMRLRKRRTILTGALSLTVAVFAGPVAAQEHPKEHPKEHPGSGVKALTVDELADAVTAWVKAESEKTGGKLEVQDDVENRTLRLELAKVHRDKLSTVGPDTHFVCADFTAEDGTTYDVDVFMEGPDKEHLTTTEVTVHKKDGKARYTWHEEGGLWKKKQAGA